MEQSAAVVINFIRQNMADSSLERSLKELYINERPGFV
jgi:hypothetical protein